MKKFFGTDGIRGVAGEFPLDSPTVYALGLALGDDLRLHHGDRAGVVMGEDTRESSRAIAVALAAGLGQRGIAIAHAGVIPTPAVAHLARSGDFGAGIMISASHNPYQDNGIKIFGDSGFKLPDAEEAEIERALTGYLDHRPRPTAAELAKPIDPDPALRADYIRSLADAFRATDFSGLRVVVDCSHGAASSVVRELFDRIGLEPMVMADQPDGRNINAGVGAVHPESMAERVRSSGANAGVALDGDADRAILADQEGRIVNGDSVLLLAARELQACGALTPPVVVGTVMTNLGLELTLRQEGIQLHRAAVGDKYVLEKMLELGAALGGEPSGHVIFGAEATTGDGLRTALHCFDLMARRRQPLRDLCAGWREFPQRIVNVRVREKVPLESLTAVQRAIQAAESHFRGAGRILVRYSGTEQLARVMVEAEHEPDVDAHAEAIAQALRRSVGVVESATAH